MSHKETILYSLKMIDNLVRKLMDRHITADKQGLTIMHTWIVGFLYNNPDRAVYQRDIEREFRVNRATVSGMVSLMEQKELIRRLSVSHDARLKKLELTQLGRELHEKQVRRFEALEGTMEDALTPEELRQLFVITDKLRHTLETLVQNDSSVVTTGGSGFGIAGILVAIDRKFISREEGVARDRKSTRLNSSHT